MNQQDRLFYIDPQSGGNLAVYDHGVFSNIGQNSITYWCGKQYPYLEDSNIDIKKVFSYKDRKTSIGKAVSYSLSMLRLLCNGFNNRPKAIHIQWLKLFWIDYIVYQIFSKIIGSKIIFTAHNIIPHEATESDIKHYRSWYKVCDAIICHTETSQKELVSKMKVPLEKTTVIPHGCLDIPCSNKEVDSVLTELRTMMRINPNQIVFGHLGFLSEYKGSDLLIKAWCENKDLRQRQDVVLLIAGKKGQINIPDELPNNIKIINKYLSNEEFKALLKLTDVMVMPYRRIDQSGLLLTLVNENIPFIVSEAGEMRRILDIADVGWCLKNIELKTISQQLIDLINSPDEIKLKRKSNEWGKLHTLFDWKEISKKTSNLYNSFIK